MRRIFGGILSIIIFLGVSGVSVVIAGQPPIAPGVPAIATAHPLATEAGYEVLRAGGNAFDAAVAVSAALAVVEPFASGLGGGGMYLLHRASDGYNTTIDGRESAPLAATHDMYLDEKGDAVADRSRYGALAAGIPGTPAALVHIARHYGRLPLSASLAPAIRYAKEGVAVDARRASITEAKLALINTYGATQFLIDGRAPKTGELIRLPDLAATLESIAADNGESFYRGEIARKFVDAVRKAGGLWTLQDLADYHAIERPPLTGQYRGLTIITVAPPSSGGVPLIEALHELDAFDLTHVDVATRAHLIVECWRRAYRDRNAYLGDPDFVKVPLAMLTDPHYALGLAASIRPDHATPSDFLPPVTGVQTRLETSHFSILDAEGNRVAGTQTINLRFGCGIVAEGTGVLLNDEMDDFTAKAGTPNAFKLVQGEANAVQPGKRPLSSMTPTFLESDRGIAIVGTPGGSLIITMVTLATLDYEAGGTADSMVSLPRFHHQYLPDTITYEAGTFDEPTRQALQARGHQLTEAPRRYGNMNVVVWDYGKPPQAATDPRTLSQVDF